MLLSRYHRSLLSPAEAEVYDLAEKTIHRRAHSMVVDGGCSNEHILKALYALEFDDPETQINLYDREFTIFREGGSKKVFPHYCASTKEEDEKRRRLEDAIDKIVEGAKKFKTEYEMELYAHDSILDGLTYHHEDSLDSETYSAYGALVNKKAVCKGISYALMMVLSRLDIWCAVIPGKKEFNHAWNIVRIDGRYYNVDATYDLQDWKTTHVYFNVDDRHFLPDHPCNIGPICDSDEHGWFTVNGRKARSTEELFRQIVNGLSDRPRFFAVAYDNIPYGDLEWIIEEALRYSEAYTYGWAIYKERQALELEDLKDRK